MATRGTVPTRYWRRLADGRVQCDLCPRACRLHEGQAGFCFVRACEGGDIVLTAYGRSSGISVDPIEKKPLFHFRPGTAVLSFGTAGCNLGCLYCQNWDISRSREIDTLSRAASPERIATAAQALGCESVAFTYNDPVIFHEYAIDVAAACHDLGLGSVAVTAGYVCAEPRAEFYRFMDAANVDLKSIRESFYERVCLGHLQPVLDTLTYLKRETKVWLEITHLVIPGENDSDEDFDALTRWMAEHLGPDVPLHLTAFHPDYRMLDHPPTRRATLRRAWTIATGNGLRYVYTGNVRDPERETTRCHQCGAALVGRDGYRLTQWTLAEGRCRACGAACAGVFDRAPGTWGARTLPVRLDDAPGWVRAPRPSAHEGAPPESL
jgi:pyruvate formate lyase activating enzyme